MERANCEEKNGGVRLPIGFRFRPTDEELVVHYLKRKVCSLPLPATVIPEFDVLHSNPWDLPGELKEKRYFFCKRKTNGSAIKGGTCSSSIVAGGGYWKGSGRERQIVAPGTNLVIGIKKSMVFFYNKGLIINSGGSKNTEWVMHVFSLVGSVNSPFSFLNQRLMIQVGDWVVCRVYQRTRKTRKQQGRIRSGACDDYLIKELDRGNRDSLQFFFNSWCFPFPQTTCSSSTISSCSSGITHISSNHDLDQEAASSPNY